MSVSHIYNNNSGQVFERLSITFTSNGKHDFAPRDQVSSLLAVYVHYFYP